jgi:tetratricopeptide (TPR) repeat protein
VAAHPENLAARTNLGHALQDSGNTDAALACYREVIRLDPKFALAHNNVGWILRTRGDWEGAIAAYRDAIRADPKLFLAHSNLGFALRHKGDIDGAIASYQEAIRHDPKDAVSHTNLGEVLLYERRDYKGAITHLREAIRVNPKHMDAHGLLAWVLATGPAGVRDGKQAVEHATRACELTAWKEPGLISTLAAAHAEAGHFDKAVELMKKALAFPAFAKEVGKTGRLQLDLYERKMPYWDPTLPPVKD